MEVTSLSNGEDININHRSGDPPHRLKESPQVNGRRNSSTCMNSDSPDKIFSFVSKSDTV